MSMYNVGDRVQVVDIHSAFYAEEGVVKSKSKDTISVSLDVGPILSRSTKRGSDFQKITTGTIKPVVQCSAQIVAVESEQSHREQPSVSSTGGAKNVKPDSAEPDPVNHPAHYTSDPSGIECIKITRHRNFNIGNAIKYLWRAGIKDDTKQIEDLKKAIWYITDEINRLEQI